MSYNFIRKIVS